MKVGFIGAGKVGVSLGKYLTIHNVDVTGYYSKTWQSAAEAAAFTHTKAYEEIGYLVADSDAVFITVPDRMISQVWKQLKLFPIENKVISHFGGALSSAVFSDIGWYKAFGYSIHPLFAINDKYTSYQALSKSFFTIEGHEKYAEDLLHLFHRMGNHAAVIRTEQKMRYHASAALVSNLYVGIVSLGEKMLADCGFTPDEAHAALAPLIQGNTDNIISSGTKHALTGPIERNDLHTVLNHLQVLTPREKEIYQVLSRQVLKVAEEKHPDRDYEAMKGVLKE